MTSALLPDTTGIRDILRDTRGTKGYLIGARHESGKSIGNHGDALMFAVFLRILDEVGIALVEEPADADVLIVRPNGALLEIYKYPEILAGELQELPDLPLIIFPSSAYFPTQDPSKLFGSRKSDVTWIFREKYSYEHIRDQWGDHLARAGVRIFLDHDVVASGHRHVPTIVGRPPRSKHILLAARIDAEQRRSGGLKAESGVQRPRASPVKRQLAALLTATDPGPLRRAAFRRYNARRTAVATQRMMRAVPQDVRDLVDRHGLPVHSIDASAKHLVSLSGYKRLVADASIVVTDRLHVALPAAILGKQVVLVEAGYHKLTGVYEQSLSKLDNVILVKRQE